MAHGSDNPANPEYDVGIVGGGPAGLTAAIWLGRYLHSVVLVDSDDPRNWETRGINGYLGLPGIRPADLRASGRDEARGYGVQLLDATVAHVRRAGDDRFVMQVDDGRELACRRLLLAIGVRDVWPDVPGLARVYGQNAHVCPDCDGYWARDRKVVVIGYGRHAVGLALDLTTWTRDIIIVTNGHSPDLDLDEYCEKLDALNIPVLTEPIVQVCSTGTSIHCLKLRNGMQLDADKIFFTMGQFPADDLGVELGCARDDEQHIIVDEHGHTSVPNVYAAGDIVPGPQLAISAASDGAIAALAIHKSLVPSERRLEPRTTSAA